MSHSYEPYNRYGATTVAAASSSERLAFIRRTYGHLTGAILLFVILEMLLFMFVAPNQLAAMNIVRPMMGGYTWLLVLGAFVLVGWIARTWAHSAKSIGMQYAGLGLYILAETAIFFPMLCLAVYATNDYNLLPKAALLTFLVFGGLTAGVFITKKDFSFLGPILFIASLLAIGVIVCGILFGIASLTLWFWFGVAMIALAAGCILYTTSNIMLHYQTNQHVAASLELFAAVALLFWYILYIFMLSGRD